MHIFVPPYHFDDPFVSYTSTCAYLYLHMYCRYQFICMSENVTLHFDVDSTLNKFAAALKYSQGSLLAFVEIGNYKFNIISLNIHIIIIKNIYCRAIYEKYYN